MFGREEQYLNECCSIVDSFLKTRMETFARFSNDFDVINYEFIFGLVYPEAELDDNNEILSRSTPLEERVHFYTGDAYTISDNEVKDSISYKETFGWQGYTNYDKLIKQFKKAGLTVIGPETFEDFKQAIINGEQFSITVSLDLSKKIDEDLNEEKIDDVESSKLRKLFGRK